MYVWQIKKLRQQLASEGLSERQAFHYYLATSILSAVLYEIVANGPSSEPGPADLLDAAMYLGFTIGGIVWCYRQNGGADGSEFLKRIVPIGWVMFWRLVSLVIPFFVVVGAIEWYRTGNLGRPGSEMPLLIIIMNGLFGGMWWRMGIHMKWVVDEKKAFAVSVGLVLVLFAGYVTAADDAETKAIDSTATQWSYQLAYQHMPDYHNDQIFGGQTRPPGADNYVQLRIVAPFKFETFTILPRLTIRHYENPNGDNGFGNTELFGLIIPRNWDWGTGRMGLGPLITAPGDKKVARDEWGYGLAGAVVNSTGKWFYGVLLTQSWRAIEPDMWLPGWPAGGSDTNPLGIAPFLNYRLGSGWYIGNGDMVIRYSWDTNEVYVPIGVRLGKVLVREKGSWNLYVEYQTSLIYDDWRGSAVENSIRFNVTYTVPVD